MTILTKHLLSLSQMNIPDAYVTLVVSIQKDNWVNTNDKSLDSSAFYRKIFSSRVGNYERQSSGSGQ